MIGWRPYLLTLLAAVLLGLVVVDVTVTVKNSSPCAVADALRADGFLSGAREKYTAMLTAHPMTVCARAGLSATTEAQCAQAQAVATVDPGQARTELMALATGDPAQRQGSCVWRELSALPQSTASASN